MRSSLVLWGLTLVGGFALVCALVAPPSVESQQPYNPKIAGPSDEGLKAIKRIRVPADCRVDLWAAEPLLANPVAFTFDEKGRCFVAETFRLHAGATDNRNHMYWLDDELACRTVADRVAVLKKHLKDKFDTYAIEHDRVRMIWDSTGKGKADKATVFADGFNKHEAGIGAGVLARHGKVWYTCIPDLWLLEEGKDGKAELKKVLSTGYGVHIAFLGHDLHGLRFGPDGRLYFSIGDRGFNVTSGGRDLVCPDTGAVLRCNPDGSNLEVVAIGLRNPQELAFDEFGNLFTCDNNADGGDAARWVNIVEGGDSGWRIGYQYLKKPMQLGAWNAEKLWGLQPGNQAAYLLPPLHHITSGPSGLTYHPGVTLLPEKYQKHFFVCDFRGGSGGSGIHAFRVEPSGASFKLVGAHQFAWSILATDCDFGPDGGFYLSDWVEGWNKPNKGRIYKITDPKRQNDVQVAEVKRLLAEGMKQRSTKEVVGLLEHPDQRVRQEAQFALGESGEPIVSKLLLRIALQGKHQLARLHALWGLSQDRGSGFPLLEILPLLKDPDPQVRAQTAKVLADELPWYFVGVEAKPQRIQKQGQIAEAWEKTARALEAALKDENARVEMYAASSLGKIGSKDSVGPLVQLARANADQDAYVRHGVVMGLVGCAPDVDTLAKLAKDDSAAVRLVGLLALRRLEQPEVARWLSDSDPRNVLEAARAINDTPIPAAFPELANLPVGKSSPDPLVYRVLNANFRLGTAANAERVAGWAARSDVSEATRLEALAMLADWAKPSGRDRVVGVWRALPQRDAALAHDALRGELAGIFSGSDKVRAEAAKVAAALKVGEVGPVLLQMVKADKAFPATVRVESLRALAALKDKKLPEAIELALKAEAGVMRAEGRRLLARREPERALPLLTAALDRGEQIEQQEALATLAEMKQPEAIKVLTTWVNRLAAGEVPPALRLDVIEAALATKSAALGKLLKAYESRKPKNDPVAVWSESLEGGNAAAGQRIFFEKAEVSCLRCHKLNGQGGDVGPDLSGIGAQQKRDYLLESIVDPNKQIAKGFETVILTLADGKIHSGIIKSETKKEVRLMTPEGQLLTIPTDEIDQRSRGKSAMPEDIIRHLSRREVRDLVEFLADQKRK